MLISSVINATPPGQHALPAHSPARPEAANAPSHPPTETMLDATLSLDYELRVLDARGAVQRMMGFALPPQPGRRLSEWCGDAEFVAAVSAGVTTNASHRTMLMRAGLDEEVRHVLVQVLPVGPGPAAVLVLISDATRQVQLEDDLMVASRVLDGIAEGVVLVDAATWRVRRANAPALVILGLDTTEVTGVCFEPLCRRLQAESGVNPSPTQIAAQTQPVEYRYLRADGSALAVEVRVERLRLARREVLAVGFRDISSRIRHAAELRAASSRCAITFSQAATGLAHVALDGRWAKVNLKLAAILGYAEQELLALSVSAVTHPHDHDADAFVHQRILGGELPYSTREKRYLRKDGAEAWVSVTTSLALDEFGAPAYFICMIDDIGERKRADERIRHLASHDLLTGLPNRAGLHDYLERVLDAAAQAQRRLGVVFVDMDKLKKINDTHGHEEGDRALVRFARHLQQAVRSGDLVARLGGDEFVIVLGDVSRRADIEATLQRTLLAVPQRPVAGDASSAGAASCSIGISIYPDDGQDARSLLRNADLAMYRAKQRGGSGYEFFSTVPAAGAPFPRLPSVLAEPY